MSDLYPARFPNEDVVQYGNRQLAAKGRTDIEWYWKSPGQAALRSTSTRFQSKLDF